LAREQSFYVLVLGGSCDIEIARKMSEKFGDFLFGHFSRVPFAVVDDEALNPVDVSLLGADAVMFASNNVAHLLEQFWFAGSRHSHYALCHDSDSVLPNPKLKPD
jgi:hypothetical protein